ncbi:hypothetical protein [Kineosporia babensis]|uniref:Uncharacterized protein n=1 Tax=Kineosporia babensis TaxID=499548 RepID=A0A9X1SU93_9ACTN|nr:hypothetical protein [Kineosporia babensis]MCD5312191.1 hypothetical protein [Kineosporia babensis]
MSVAEIIQAFGWIPVCWLLAVHILIRMGRLPRYGRAVRMAGYLAALTIVAAAVTTRMWPIAVLGLLFMRTELLGHRHAEESPEKAEPERVPTARRPLHDDDELLDDVRIHHGGGGGARLLPGRTAASAAMLNARTEPVHLGHDKSDPDFVPASVGLRDLHHDDHPPHPRDPQERDHPILQGAKHVTDIVLKVEIVAVVVIALVLFGVWAEGQRRDFVRNTNYNVCEMSSSC